MLPQVGFNAFVTGTLFFRTRLHTYNVDDANLYLAVLFFTLTAMLFNNWAEFAIVSERLSLFYKQVGCLAEWLRSHTSLGLRLSVHLLLWIPRVL